MRDRNGLNLVSLVGGILAIAGGGAAIVSSMSNKKKKEPAEEPDMSHDWFHCVHEDEKEDE